MKICQYLVGIGISVLRNFSGKERKQNESKHLEVKQSRGGRHVQYIKHVAKPLHSTFPTSSLCLNKLFVLFQEVRKGAREEYTSSNLTRPSRQKYVVLPAMPGCFFMYRFLIFPLSFLENKNEKSTSKRRTLLFSGSQMKCNSIPISFIHSFDRFEPSAEKRKENMDDLYLHYMPFI